ARRAGSVARPHRDAAPAAGSGSLLDRPPRAGRSRSRFDPGARNGTGQHRATGRIPGGRRRHDRAAKKMIRTQPARWVRLLMLAVGLAPSLAGAERADRHQSPLIVADPQTVDELKHVPVVPASVLLTRG